jgi:SAM-dependent methyltransferase
MVMWRPFTAAQATLRAVTLDPPTRARLLERAIRTGGADRDEFAGREEEMAYYLHRSAGRFARTLPLALRHAGPGARVLELGADPFFFTQLLLEAGAEVVLAGEPRGVWKREPPGSEEIALRWAGREERLELQRFDVERDRWPFGDGAFDAVVCMELLEHLTYSPAHLLHEANRVLVPGGGLVLTTPNALAAQLLARVLRGRSIGEPYSGYGPTGRHNREYTSAELEALLHGANFAGEVRAANIDGYVPPDGLGRLLRAAAGMPGARAERRRDHLFAAVRKTGPPVLAYPDWLFRAVYPERMRAGGVKLV